MLVCEILSPTTVPFLFSFIVVRNVCLYVIQSLNGSAKASELPVVAKRLFHLFYRKGFHSRFNSRSSWKIHFVGSSELKNK